MSYVIKNSLKQINVKKIFSILVSCVLMLLTSIHFSFDSFADDGLGDVVSTAVSGAGVGAAVGGATAGPAGVGVGAAIGACVAGCAQVTADIIDAVYNWEKSDKNPSNKKD